MSCFAAEIQTLARLPLDQDLAGHRQHRHIYAYFWLEDESSAAERVKFVHGRSGKNGIALERHINFELAVHCSRDR